MPSIGILRSIATTRARALLLALSCLAVPRHPAAAQPAVPSRDAEPVTAAMARATFDSAWRRIGATYYDTTMRGVDWDAVRAELLPRAEAARTLGALRATLRELATRLGDSHFGLLAVEDTAPAVPADEAPAAPGAGAPGDVGAVLRVLDGALVVVRTEPGAPAERAGLVPGWRVEAVGGVDVAGELRDAAALDGEARRRAELGALMHAEHLLTGDSGRAARVRARDRDGRVLSLAIPRRRAPGLAVTFGNLGTVMARLAAERVRLPDGGCAGIIGFDLWMLPLRPQIDSAIDALRDCRGLVLDLRGNRGGVAGMSMAVASWLVHERTELGVLRARGIAQRFVAEPRRVTDAGAPTAPYDGPVALLVDEHSASTTEFFAAALQESGRVRVFGARTAGQALPAAALRLPTGDVLVHAVGDFTTPRGARVEGRGVTPDVPVPLRLADVLAGRDAAREAALAWIAGAPTPR
ncbi:MAG TPA: S41 family peptidase [Gemmatimonadaceae bacterium]|nr:S41 family peptidase [Gemmatimonadaceae bacterium]